VIIVGEHDKKMKPKLRKVISGGQTGADIAGVMTAKKFGYEVGGWMPLGFKTLAGSKPRYAELYGMLEHSSASYPPRTHCNVSESDGTIRFAFNFDSAGEKCTLKAIEKFKKHHIDVDCINPRSVSEVVLWIIQKEIEILNVAGNSEKSAMGITEFVEDYLSQVFDSLRYIGENYVETIFDGK